METVILYTDGACSGNPGPGGWGAILKYGEHILELSGGEKNTTNNRMEIYAVIAGLSALKKPCKVELYSDSRYVINSISLGWAKKWRENNWIKSDKKKALNIDLWDKLLSLLDVYDVSCHWVKGHSTNYYNNRCDEMAVKERLKLE